MNSKEKLFFSKVQNLGNDFILFDFVDKNPLSYEKILKRPKNVRMLCRRAYGIGADGILLMKRDSRGRLNMEIINSDGSFAMMCGNGLACFALYAYGQGYVSGGKFPVITRSGERFPEIMERRGKKIAIRLDMGEPILEPRRIPFAGREDELDSLQLKLGKKKFDASVVSMGNPHLIIWHGEMDAVELSRIGPELENHPLFPEKTNVHFVERKSDSLLSSRIWERGAGMTLACGTGACAVAVAAFRRGFTGRKVTVEQPGGPQKVTYASDNHVYLDAVPEIVFSGVLPLEKLA